jgi:glycine oxidase
MSHDLIVVGGGAIGLAIARSFAPARSVLLLERSEPGRRASWAAAGMLCPHSEAVEDDPLLRFGLDCLESYPAFAAELQDETGIDVEYRRDGVLVLAATREEMDTLGRRAAWQQQAGLDTRLLSRGEVARLEPELTLEIEGALFCPGDHQVRPRRLLEALERSCRLRGVDLVPGAAADEVLVSGGAVRGVRVGTTEIFGKSIVIAAGAWASLIEGLAPPVEVRPRKGQILALQMPKPMFRHLIRWKNLYFVPRSDDQLVVGATNEESGFDQNLTAGGLGGLLDGAQQMASSVGGLPILETWAGLRPMIPDGLPAIGPARVEGLYSALGHYRNGILLTPGTVKLIHLSVAGEGIPPYGEALSPMRMAESVSSGEV